MWTSTLVAACAVLIVSRIFAIFSKLQRVGRIPGFRCLFGPLSVPGSFLPTTVLNPGLDWRWLWRKTVYKHYGSRTISAVPLICGAPLICTASLDVAKQVLSGDKRYYKGPTSTAALRLWGENVLSAEHDVYKKHRKIIGPAFTGSTYVAVARQTVNLYKEMIEGEGWDKLNVIELSSINEHMQKFALGVFTRCGFGMPFHWVSPDDPDMSYEEALAAALSGAAARVAIPRIAYRLPIKRLRKLDKANKRMVVLIRQFVETRRSELAGNHEADDATGRDILTRLVYASQLEGEKGLTDSELIGNVFALMFAGHETTGHTLSATLALLALHNDEQDMAVKNIFDVLCDGRDPTFDDYPKLERVRACFQEAARMFPSTNLVIRDTAEAVVLSLPHTNGSESLVVPPGVRILIDMIGIHYDEERFPDPERFDPSRWLGVPERDLTFFGMGPRACLARKFALTEVVLVLTMLLRDWKVSVRLERGESMEQWRLRVMNFSLIGLGFGIQPAPLVLTRRT